MTYLTIISDWQALAPQKSIQNKTAFRADMQKLGISNFFQLYCRAKQGMLKMKQHEQLLTSQSWAVNPAPFALSAAKARAQLPPMCAQMLCPWSGMAKQQHHWNSLICNSHNLHSLRTFASVWPKEQMHHFLLVCPQHNSNEQIEMLAQELAVWQKNKVKSPLSTFRSITVSNSFQSQST